MVSVVDLVLMGVLIVPHTLIAAVMTCFFRLRLKMQRGYTLYALLLIPPVLLVSMLVFSGVFGIGVNLGSPTVALGVVIGMPLAPGFTIDMLYVPPSEEYENLPNSWRTASQSATTAPRESLRAPLQPRRARPRATASHRCG